MIGGIPIKTIFFINQRINRQPLYSLFNCLYGIKSIVFRGTDTMRMVVLGGAGLMGAGIVRDLVSEQSDGIKEVIVADNNEAGIERLKSSISDERIKYVELDVKNNSLMQELLSNADICINSVPTFAGLQMEIFLASLAAKCPYIDLGGMGVYTRKQKEEHDRWVDAGVPAIVGAGSDPGMSNVLCKAVAEELDTIEKINLYWAGKPVGPDNPVIIPLYNIKTILAEYYNPNHQFLNGKLTEVPAQTGKETILLPEPFGETEFMYSQHSEPSTVPFAKGIAEKGIQEMTWKLHLPDEDDTVWKSLVKAGFGEFDDAISINGIDIKPGDFLTALIGRNLERNADKVPEQSDYQIHFAIGVGKKNGLRTRATCTVTSEPDDFFSEYHEASTSMNASFSAQLVLQQENLAGVWGPEEFFDVSRYFDELRKRHFSIKLDVQTELLS